MRFLESIVQWLRPAIHGLPWRAVAIPLGWTALFVAVAPIYAPDLTYPGVVLAPMCVSCVMCVICVICTLWSHRVAWRLERHVSHFPTLTRERIVLRYAPRNHWPYPATLLRHIEEDYRELKRRFGFAPRGRMRVYLLSDPQSMRVMFGRAAGGFAICPNTVVVANSWYTREAVRHEMVHLFSAAWNDFSRPLLSEGLAVWMQETEGGVPVDERAIPVLGRRDLRLAALLKNSFFRAPGWEHDCYVLAGSFTGFLIRRLGWGTYRRFYKEVRWRGYRKALKRVLGMTLEEAEARWRAEILLAQTLRARMRIAL
jgi:hypothetical protein